MMPKKLNSQTLNVTIGAAAILICSSFSTVALDRPQWLVRCGGLFDLCGYIDRVTREEVISKRFERAMFFSEGLAPVRIKGFFGYIDRTGQVVIEPKFDLAGQFQHGLAEVVVDGKAGVIDRTGQFVIEPMFARAVPFSGEVVLVKEGDWRRRHIPGFSILERFGDAAWTSGHLPYGLFHVERGWIVRPKFEFSVFDAGASGLIWARKYGARDEPWGLLRADGAWHVEPIYRSVSPLRGGRAAVKGRNGKWGAVDQSGTLVVSTLFQSHKSVAADQPANSHALRDEVILRCRSGLTIRHREGKRWIETRDGAPISGRPFELIKRHPRNCSAPLVVKQDGLWGFVTQDGGQIPDPPSFEVAHGFFGGYARVKVNEKWGVIAEDGRFSVDPMFDDLRRAGETVFRAELNGLVVWIDPNGRRVAPPDWQAEGRRSIIECPGGGVLFRRDGKWGMRGPDGSILIEPEHRALDCYRQGIAWAARDDRTAWCPLGLDGEWQAGPECSERYAPIWVSHHYPERLADEAYESSVLWMIAFLEYGAGLRGQPPKMVGDGVQGRGEFLVDKRHGRREWEFR